MPSKLRELGSVDPSVSEYTHNRLRRIQVLAEMRRSVVDNHDTVGDHLIAYPEGFPPISIVGERGAGKTTLLQLSRHKLHGDDANIVLDTVKPELFSAEDSMFVHVLAALERACASRDLTGEAVTIGNETMALGSWLDLAMRQAALSRTGFEDRLSFQSVSPEQFAADFTRVSRSERDFIGLWQRLTHEVGSIVGAVDRPGLVVVPIDDADLVPEFLPQLFLELRLLSSASHVLPIASLNLRETRLALLANLFREGERVASYEHLLQHGLAQAADFRLAVEKQLIKALPPDSRISLTPIDLLDRLDFAPSSRPDSALRKLFESDELQEVSSRPLELFVRNPGKKGEFFTFAMEAIPGVPRELGILCTLLAGGDATGSTRMPAAERWREFLESLADFAAFGEQVFSDPDAIRIRTDGDQVLVRQRSGPVTLAFGPSPGLSISWSVEDSSGSKGASVSLSPLGEVIIRTRPFKRQEQAQDWPTSYAAAYLLIQELSIESEGIVRGPGSGPLVSVPPGILYPYVQVSINGELTDDQFFQMPHWERLTDICDFIEAWNRFLGRGVADGAAFGAVPPEALEWVAIQFLAMITDVAAGGGFRLVEHLDSIGEARFTKSGKTGKALRDQTWKVVLESVAEEYGRSGSQDARRSVYRRWFEQDLVQILHPALLPPERIQQVLEAREASLRSVRRLQRGNERAIRRLDERTRLRSPGRWLDELATLASAIDQEAGREMAERLGMRRRESRELRLGQVATSGTPSSDPADAEAAATAAVEQVERRQTGAGE